MRALSKALILPVLTAASLAMASDPEWLLPAATMDPYLPIRNSALQFELGVGHVGASSFYASKKAPDSTTKAAGECSGTDAVNYADEASLTQFNVKIRHGFVANTEAVLELPVYMASGAAERYKPVSTSDSGEKKAAGVGDLSLGIKSAYEPWGLGGYFGLYLPVGSDAYTHGDGQINMGIMWDYTWNERFTVMSNFVFGYNLPAVNGRIDQQHNWSGYLRCQGEFVERKYRPYLAFQYEGRGEYTENDTKVADGGYRVLVIPGIDATLFGDFSAELNFPISVIGKGNYDLATANSWGVNFALKYFWFRY